MKVVIISVGKKHDKGLAEVIDDYQKRIDRTLSVEWQFLPPSSFDADVARKTESAKIINLLKDSDVVWLLDERGEQISSPALANKLQVLKVHAASRLVLVIGGAYGVDDILRQRATWVWSMSKLVFPHQLVRLMLVEQLYRASEIERGSGYHHA